jgi:hypothetical protein
MKYISGFYAGATTVIALFGVAIALAVNASKKPTEDDSALQDKVQHATATAETAYAAALDAARKAAGLYVKVKRDENLPATVTAKV